jgi:hypothetical protein
MRSFPIELGVRTPCEVSSDELVDAREGYYCQSCEKVVHELSRLTFDQAEALFRSARRYGSRVCADMLVRRSDGAVLFADGYALPPSAKRRLPLAANAVAAAGAMLLVACAETPEVVPELPRSPLAAPAPEPSRPIEPIAVPMAAAPTPIEPTPVAPVRVTEAEPVAPAQPPVSQAAAQGTAHPKANPKGKKPDHRQMRGDMAL